MSIRIRDTLISACADVFEDLMVMPGVLVPEAASSGFAAAVSAGTAKP